MMDASRGTPKIIVDFNSRNIFRSGLIVDITFKILRCTSLVNLAPSVGRCCQRWVFREFVGLKEKSGVSYIYVVKDYNRDIWYSTRKYEAFGFVNKLKRENHEYSNLEVWRYDLCVQDPVPVKVEQHKQTTRLTS